MPVTLYLYISIFLLTMLAIIFICVSTINNVLSAYNDIDLNGFTTGLTGYKVFGADVSARLGSDSKSVGDFNGDGREDIIFGSRALNRVYIFFGRTGNIESAVDMANFVSSASTGIIILGETVGDNFGEFLDSAGDVNGDGYDDIIVGAQSATNTLGFSGAGKAYVVFGRPNSQGVVDIATATMPATSGYRILGPSANANCGRDVGGAGDINGDGLDDVAIGCFNINEAFVIFGKASGFADIDLVGLSSDSRGFSITGAGASRLGWTTNPAGDFNHDGYDDLFIGAPLVAYSAQTQCGAAYIVFGHSTSTAFPALTATTDLTSGTGGFAIYGTATNTFCAEAGGYIGDINDDGVDDIAVGCYGTTALDRASAGAVYILFGNPFTTSFPAVDLASFTSSSSRGFRIWGAAASDRLGMSLGYAGDMNGDGISDMILGVRYVTALGRTNAGTAYVLFGRRNTTAAFIDLDLASFTTGATTGFRMFGAATSHQMFMSVASAGDVNGDGLDDLLVSSDMPGEPGRTYCGIAYVIYGVRERPTSQPSSQPSSQPVSLPSAQPSSLPSSQPSVEPSTQPTTAPSAQPSVLPSTQPSSLPSSQPSVEPSTQPTTAPSAQPSVLPSTQPSSLPSSQPSVEPSTQPTTAPSAQPSVLPSAQPSSLPSSQPSSHPSSQPSSQPSCQPTSQPTVDLRFITKVRASPTYRVRNGFAFAVTSANGTVHTWGEAMHGGDSSAVSAYLAGNVTKVVPARFAYAALKDDGSVVPWGAADAIHGLDAYPPGSYALSELIANEAAFAGIDAGTGRVIAFGSQHVGGNVLSDVACNGYAQQLTANIIALAASAGAFAALSSDGSVYAWGNKHAGGGVSHEFLASLPPIQLVVATRSSFAALSLTGRVFAWGDALSGGDTSSVSAQLASGVVHIIAAKSVFLAFKNDTSLVVWGYGETGGDASTVAAELSANVTFVAHTFVAMAALKSDGTVVTWGRIDGGGDSSVVQAQLQDVQWIYGNSKAFAALTAAGKVVAWGKAAFGGQIPSNKVSALSSGVVSIYHTDRAFAALKDDGSVVVWGQAGHGGSPGAAVESLLTSGVHTICSNDAAFSVIKTDGSVVGWGHPVSIPTVGVLFNSNVLTVHAECA